VDKKKEKVRVYACSLYSLTLPLTEFIKVLQLEPLHLVINPRPDKDGEKLDKAFDNEWLSMPDIAFISKNYIEFFIKSFINLL
jgi:hypothetical protein